MNKIVIKNIGPIKDASIDLKRINIFIGPQSSGKSTIAKLISFCTWLEKDIILSTNINTYENVDVFRNKLVDYHKIKGYFNVDSYLSYESDTIKFIYQKNSTKFDWVDKYSYEKSKIFYIPSERNIVILPELQQYNFPNNSIRDFLFDWLDARDQYVLSNSINILKPHLNYYYNKISSENHIKYEDDIHSYDILLSNASSGLQSLVPLVVVIEYAFNLINSVTKQTSFDKKGAFSKKMSDMFRDNVENYYKLKGIKFSNEEINNQIINDLNQKNVGFMQMMQNYASIYVKMLLITSIQVIIEEPEQNLFPGTQKDVMYYLLTKVNNYSKKHRLTITTHSPYILYALNNCMLGYLVKNKLSKPSKSDKLVSNFYNSFINPQEVAVWSLKDGSVSIIQDEDGLIGKNYFDDCMANVMDDYYRLINFF